MNPKNLIRITNLDLEIFRIFHLDKVERLFSDNMLVLVRPAMWDDPFENFLLKCSDSCPSARALRMIWPRFSARRRRRWAGREPAGCRRPTVGAAGDGRDSPPQEARGGAETSQKHQRPRWRRVLERVAIGVGVTLLVLVAIAGLLYSFGGMERPTAEYRAAYASMVAQGTAAPIQGRFTIPIPGCRCHSDDPAQQLQHSTYRLSECRGCH